MSGRYASIKGNRYSNLPSQNEIENHNNVLQRAAQASAGIKEPFPYLNWIPGMKDVNRGLVESGGEMEAMHPGYLKSNREQQFTKELGGSVLAGGAVNSAATKLPSVFRGALSGAAAAQPFHYDSIKNRGLATGGGVLLGGVTEPLMEGIGFVGDKLGNVLKSGGRLATAESELANLSNQKEALKAPVSTAYGPLTEGQGTQMGQKVLGKARASITGELEAQGKTASQNLTKDYKGARTDLANKFTAATKKETIAYKEAMEEANKANSGIYGERLDELQSGIKSPITPEEYHKEVLEPTLQEIAQKRLPLGGPESAVKSWAQKFGPKVAEEVLPQTNELGLVIAAPKAEPPAPLTLRGLNNIKNDVMEAQDYATKMGTQKTSPQDLAAQIYYKNHKAFLNKRVEGHSQLQQDFAPMAESGRKVFKSIRPGEEDLQPGMNMLQKAAKGNANPAKLNPDIEDNLSRVERGVGGFKGTGNLRDESTNIAKHMRDLDIEYTGNKEELLNQINKKISDIESSFAQDAATLKRAGMKSKENMLERQGAFAARETTLKKSIQDLKRLKAIRNWAIGLGTTILGGKKIYDEGKRAAPLYTPT